MTRHVIESFDAKRAMKLLAPPLAIALSSAFLLSLYLSPSPFWTDALGYANALETGKSVAHPPGYIGFLWVGGLLYHLLGSSYQALQLVSAGSYLVSIPLVYIAIRWRKDTPTAAIFTFSYAMSWICLNIATVGTSHASDLFFGAALACLASTPRTSQKSPLWHTAVFLIVAAAAAFRMSTVVMLIPFLLLVMIRDFRHRAFWISATIAAILVAGIVAATASAYGSWNDYREATKELNVANAKSSFLLGGPWNTSGMNILRAGFWSFMAAPLLPFLLLAKSARVRTLKNDFSLWFLTALIGGCLAINFGYLCVHPGYLAPMLPVYFILIAQWLKPTRQVFATCLLQSALSIGIFFALRPIAAPVSPAHAAINSFLLQYSAASHHHAAAIRPVSEWLMESGQDELVPPHRRESIETNRRRDSNSSQ